MGQKMAHLDKTQPSTRRNHHHKTQPSSQDATIKECPIHGTINNTQPDKANTGHRTKTIHVPQGVHTS
jgi:hypothetical protein